MKQIIINAIKLIFHNLSRRRFVQLFHENRSFCAVFRFCFSETMFVNFFFAESYIVDPLILTQFDPEV